MRAQISWGCGREQKHPHKRSFRMRDGFQTKSRGGNLIEVEN